MPLGPPTPRRGCRARAGRKVAAPPRDDCPGAPPWPFRKRPGWTSRPGARMLPAMATSHTAELWKKGDGGWPSGHELHDEALFHGDGERDLASLGEAGQPPANGFLVPLHIGRRVGRHLERLANRDHVLTSGGRLDGLPGLNSSARYVHPLAVELDMAVGDQLAGLGHRLGEAQAENQRIQTRLEQPEELLARDGLLPSGLVEVPAELALAHAVDGPQLLLLEEAEVELGHAPPGPAVLAGWEGSLGRGAIGPSADRGTDPPAHPVFGSELLHQVLVAPGRGPGRHE